MKAQRLANSAPSSDTKGNHEHRSDEGFSVESALCRLGQRPR